MTQKELVPFGKEFREKYFNHVGHDVIPVNHGSFGLSPELILDQYYKEILQENYFPDFSLRNKARVNYKDALKELGNFLNCDYQNLAIVSNASTAVNIILRSYPFQKGDKIVVASTSYGSCYNTVKFIEKKLGIISIVISLDYPLEDDEVIQKFKDVFEKESPTLCMFDAVSSLPGVKVPYIEIAELCKRYNILSLIDGAHSVGLMPVNLDFKPDFYLSCLHKWLYVPRGCAVMYVDKKHFHRIHTIPISHSYVDDDAALVDEKLNNLLISKFEYCGTSSIANYNIIKYTINFRKDICGGEDNIRNYCYNLANEVGKYISEMWGTSVLENHTKTLSTALVNIELPLERLAKQYNVNQEIELEKSNGFKNMLDPLYGAFDNEMMDRNTFVPLFFHNGKVWARFSCQIYNELDDYVKASNILIDCLENYLKALR